MGLSLDDIADVFLKGEREDKKPLENGEDIKIMNNMKVTMLDIIDALAKDLPNQLSSQAESKAQKMRENIKVLFEKSDFIGFFKAYKLTFEEIVGMTDVGKKEEGDLPGQKDEFNDLSNIRSKLLRFESLISKVDKKMEEEKDVNLMGLRGLLRLLSERAENPVERQKKPKFKEDDEE